ncbi:MAG: hypothetical protein HLUCCA11_17010 [Phormidesmis priestleyi Ana]|uniref:Uncharacterized protein n=1 Tax=Phormidesmis priestleyi Ana TaxID=1666911 RepID=A0A0P7ZU90_9CYAN|nr:MAG: hypothetical protein HLUCCA11_17010 [Phormidesmis priestleyi Ana]
MVRTATAAPNKDGHSLNYSVVVVVYKPALVNQVISGDRNKHDSMDAVAIKWPTNHMAN